MALTLNMVGGGGGSLSATDAILRVQAPARSTVMIAKGGITKTDLGHESANRPTVYDYYFIIHRSQFDSINSWTVTATRDTDSNATTVIIDAPDEYNISIGYHVPIGEYQEVEFLQSSGTQYINPNFVTTQSFKVNLKFQPVGFKSGNNIWGKQGWPENNYGYPTSMYTEQNGVLIAPNSGTSYNDSASNTGFQFVIGTDYTAEYYYTKDGTAYVSLNGNVLKTYAATTRNSVNRSMLLFATYDYSSSNDGPNYFGIYKIYYWYLRDNNGVMQREMYPCYRLSDSQAGMYDRVNGVFYPGKGTGTFIVGADVS